MSLPSEICDRNAWQVCEAVGYASASRLWYCLATPRSPGLVVTRIAAQTLYQPTLSGATSSVARSAGNLKGRSQEKNQALFTW